MKPKKSLFILAFVMSAFCACEQNAENSRVNALSSLIGTKWKLEALVDEKGKARKPEPESCSNCYTVIFDSDTTFFGMTSNNEVSGIFCADFEQSTFSVKEFGGTKRGEIGDGAYYWDQWHKMQSLSLTENELILYFDNKNGYLKFKPLEK